MARKNVIEFEICYVFNDLVDLEEIWFGLNIFTLKNIHFFMVYGYFKFNYCELD